jgi:hypothetical protein
VRDAVVRRIIPVEVIHDDVSSWKEIAEASDEILQFHLTTQELPQLNSLVDYIHHHFKAGRTVLSIRGPDLVHRYRLLDLALRRLNCRMPVDLLVPEGSLP